MLAKNRRDRFLVVMRRRERRRKRTLTTTRKIGNNTNNTRYMDDWSLQSLGWFLSSMLTALCEFKDKHCCKRQIDSIS